RMELESVGIKKRGKAIIRVSTTRQRQVQHGSPEQQRHTLERWAQREGERQGCVFEIIGFIEEDISGRAESLHKRHGYQAVVRSIRAGLIDFVVFEKLDRLSRDKIENQRFVEIAYENCVEVYEAESGRIDLRDRGSRLGFNFKNMLAEEYSLELEEKVTKK